MKNFRTIITIILFGVYLFSCNISNDKKYIYPDNPAISDKKGVPKDSSTYYFPASTSSNGIQKMNLDSFQILYYSNILFLSNEPVLSNFYLGHDIYRFLWLRSFDRPIIISLHKSGENVWLETKVLDKYPKPKYGPFVVDSLGNKLPESPDEQRLPKIVKNEKKQLTINEWEKFESLINECDFWSQSQTKFDTGLDGSNWIIEGHLKNNYCVIDRWSPKDKFKLCGSYLIDLSELKEKRY